jgi:hypothetical protein
MSTRAATGFGALLAPTRAGNDYAGVGSPRVYGNLVIGTSIDASGLSVASLRHIFVGDAGTGAPIINYDNKGILGSRPALINGRTGSSSLTPTASETEAATSRWRPQRPAALEGPTRRGGRA